MSILDFTTGLFREPANLRSFVDNPDQALKDAGLPDATPDQIHDLLPMVAESMPLDHPLQTVVHRRSVRALPSWTSTSSSPTSITTTMRRSSSRRSLDLPSAAPATKTTTKTSRRRRFTSATGTWSRTATRASADLLAPRIEEGDPEPVDDYPEDLPRAEEPSEDHAIAEGFVDTP